MTGDFFTYGGTFTEYEAAVLRIGARLTRHRIPRARMARDLGVTAPELSRWLNLRREMRASTFLELERGSRALARRVLAERREAR